MKRPYQVALALYMLFLLWALCVRFTAPDTQPIPGLMETAHMGLFGGMSVLIGVAFRRSQQDPGPALLYLAPLVAAAAYGLFLECVQIALPHRTFDWYDVAYNLAGAALAQAVPAAAYRTGRIPAADRAWLPRWGNL